MRLMEKIGYILVTIFVVLTSSCSDEILEDKVMVDATRPYERELKVLCIGNSFTEDAFSYVPALFFMAAPDVKLTIGIAYIGGSPLVQHWANLTGKSTTLDGTTISPKTYTYYKAESVTAQWHSCKNVSIDKILSDEQWDIITFQQNGGTSGRDYDTYFAPYLVEIKQFVRSKTKGDPKLGWVLIHGAYYNSDDGLRMSWYNGMLNSRRVMEDAGFDLLFPYGTAVQNLRDNREILNESAGPGWTFDNGHLQEGLGCLVSAYANALVLFNELKMTPERELWQFNIDKELLDFMSVPDQHIDSSGLTGISDKNCRKAYEAALAAVAEPYSVTLASIE
ncbi:MAG: DUF4886 domain-containing protein [Muribaculaceae bacterium]|nr:DUF4886 domain-containing protein [Muribaculaceae bacterium]